MKHYLVTVSGCTVSWLVQANHPRDAVDRAHERHMRGEAPERITCEETVAVIEEVNMRAVSYTEEVGGGN